VAASERSPLGEPRAVEAQVGSGDDEVKVGVVVQNAVAVAIGEGGDQELDGRQAMMAGARELSLST